MKALFTLIFTGLLSFGSNAHAEATALSPQQVFESLFFSGNQDPNIPQLVTSPTRLEYQALWCPQNVLALTARFAEAGIDLSAAEVLYLVPDANESLFLAPLQPRVQTAVVNAAQKVEWAFHVVLVLNNQVFDLDFGNTPKSVSSQVYFDQMWGASHPLVRSVPARDYLSSYSGHWSWFAHLSDSVFPLRTLSDWKLNRVSSRGPAIESFAREWGTQDDQP